MNIYPEKIEVKKTKVTLTVSIETNCKLVDESHGVQEAQAIINLLSLAVTNGSSVNIIKQLTDMDFDDDMTEQIKALQEANKENNRKLTELINNNRASLKKESHKFH